MVTFRWKIHLIWMLHVFVKLFPVCYALLLVVTTHLNGSVDYPHDSETNGSVFQSLLVQLCLFLIAIFYFSKLSFMWKSCQLPVHAKNGVNGRNIPHNQYTNRMTVIKLTNCPTKQTHFGNFSFVARPSLCESVCVIIIQGHSLEDKHLQWKQF